VKGKDAVSAKDQEDPSKRKQDTGRSGKDLQKCNMKGDIAKKTALVAHRLSHRRKEKMDKRGRKEKG